jgi:hypothetical protein
MPLCELFIKNVSLSLNRIGSTIVMTFANRSSRITQIWFIYYRVISWEIWDRRMDGMNLMGAPQKYECSKEFISLSWF